MAQRPSGNEIVTKVRSWLEQRLQGILHGPEVGPDRTQQRETSGATEPEPSEAAREERGRRDAGVAQDAQDLDSRSTSLTGQPSIDTVESGTEVVTATADEDEDDAASAVSGEQHSQDAMEPSDAADVPDQSATAQADDMDAAEAETPPTMAENQHDLDSVEPTLDTTRADDAATDRAGAFVETDEASREESRAWEESEPAATTAGAGSTGSTGAAGVAGAAASTGMPEAATGVEATAEDSVSDDTAATSGMPEGATGVAESAEDTVQADAETGSTWAPVHGDTAYDEMTREPVENLGGQPASVVPDVGGVTGTAGATNLDDSAGAPAEQVGLDDVAAQVSDLQTRPPSETDFPDEPANIDTPEDDGDSAFSGDEGEAADLQFGGANEDIGFGTFDSRPEEVEEAGVALADPDAGDSPEEFGVAGGTTEIVPDSDDASLAGDLERDVNADETGGGTNIAAAAAAIDADAGYDAPRGAVRGDGTPSCPSGYPVKGNASSKIYHVPGSSSYEATKAEFCFATEADAAAAGYRPPRGR